MHPVVGKLREGHYPGAGAGHAGETRSSGCPVQAGFSNLRTVAETPFNIVVEAKVS